MHWGRVQVKDGQCSRCRASARATVATTGLSLRHDGRSAAKGNALALLTSAQAEIRDKIAKKTFSFKPVATTPGSKYRLDWDLGYRVTVFWAGIAEQDLRIASVEITVGEDGEELSVGVKNIV